MLHPLRTGMDCVTRMVRRGAVKKCLTCIAADLLVDLISAEDGREAIVGLTQALCEPAVREQLDQEQITATLIDSELADTIIPEPELLILFTREPRLQGFPPWQIRLTEIL